MLSPRGEDGPRPEGPYEIVIDEQQRKIIVLALVALSVTHTLAGVKAPVHGAVDRSMLDSLQRMFDELPAENSVRDGKLMVHGFCL